MPPLLPASNTFTANFPSLFGETSVDRCLPDALESSLGPLAYLVELFDTARALDFDYENEPVDPLARRRPDVTGLLLDEPALKKRLPKLTLVIEILEALVARSSARGNENHAMVAAEVLANAASPTGMPFDKPWDLTMRVRRYKNLLRWDALRQTDRDYPGFANEGASASGMREALQMCTDLSPSQLKALTMPGASTLGATLRERLGAGSDATLDTLKDSGTLRKVLGLSRKQLRQILAVNGVAAKDSAERHTSVSVNLHGAPGGTAHGGVFAASYLNAGADATTTLRLLTTANARQNVDGLTAGHLDRLWRLLSIKAALKVSFADTDRLLQACFNAQGKTGACSIDDHVLRTLGLSCHLYDSRRISVDAFAAVIHQISPYATGRNRPYYERLFGAGSGALTMDGEAFAETTSDPTIAQLSRGLKIAPETTLKLISWVKEAGNLPMPVRTLAFVSSVHRLAILPVWLGLNEASGLALMRLLKVGCPAVFTQLAGNASLATDSTATAPDVVDAIVTAMNLAEWLRQHALDADRVRAVLSPWTADTSTLQHARKLIQTRWGENKTGALKDSDFLEAFKGMVFHDRAEDEVKRPLIALEPLVWPDGSLSTLVLQAKDRAALEKSVRIALRHAAKRISVWDEVMEIDESHGYASMRKTTAPGATTINEAIRNVAPKVADILTQARNLQRLRIDELLVSLLPGINDADTRDALRRWAVIPLEDLHACYLSGDGAAELEPIAGRLRAPSELVSLLRLTAMDVKAILARPDAFGLATAEQPKRIRPLDLVTIHRLTDWNLVVGEGVRRSGSPQNDVATAVLAWLREGMGDGKSLASILGIDTSQLGISGNRITTVPDMAWLMRVLAIADKANVSGDAITALGALGPSSTASQVQTVADRLLASCDDFDRDAIRRQHHAAWRDALVAWSLVHAQNGNDSAFTDQDDLASWLLTDIAVGPEPETTRVDAAIDSLQLYIHRLLSGLELRLVEDTALVERHNGEWKQWRSRYSTWLDYNERKLYPSNHIDPSRRLYKTKAFTELENQLAQGQVRAEDIDQTLLAYISAFERLSNIQVVAGYHDGLDPSNDKLHLIGRSNSEPMEYFWRTADMSRKAPDGEPAMIAWGEWEPITLPVVGELVWTNLQKSNVASVEATVTDAEATVKTKQDTHDTAQTTAKASQDIAGAAEATATQKTQALKDKESANQAKAALDNAKRALDVAKQKLANARFEADDPRTTIPLLRPLTIDGRPYVVWLERDNSAIVFDKTNASSEFYATRLCFAYRGSDGVWSPSNTLLALDGRTSDGRREEPPTRTTVKGICKDRWNLVTREYKPSLIAMENRKGHQRAKDPHLVALLIDATARDFIPDWLERAKDFDAQTRSANASIERYNEALKRNPPALWNGILKLIPLYPVKTISEQSLPYYLVVRDLLLVDNLPIDTSLTRAYERKLVDNWKTLFADPRVLQHPYVGSQHILELNTNALLPASQEAPADKTANPTSINKISLDKITARRQASDITLAELTAAFDNATSEIEVTATFHGVAKALATAEAGSGALTSLDDIKECHIRGEFMQDLKNVTKKANASKNEVAHTVIKSEQFQKTKEKNIYIINTPKISRAMLFKAYPHAVVYFLESKSKAYYAILLQSLKGLSFSVSPEGDKNDNTGMPKKFGKEAIIFNTSEYDSNVQRIFPEEVLSALLEINGFYSIEDLHASFPDSGRQAFIYVSELSDITTKPKALAPEPFADRTTSAKAEISLITTNSRATRSIASFEDISKEQRDQIKPHIDLLGATVKATKDAAITWLAQFDDRQWVVSAEVYYRAVKGTSNTSLKPGRLALTGSIPFWQAWHASHGSDVREALIDTIVRQLLDGKPEGLKDKTGLDAQLCKTMVRLATTHHSVYRATLDTINASEAGPDTLTTTHTDTLLLSTNGPKTIKARFPVDLDQRNVTVRFSLSATEDPAKDNDATAEQFCWLAVERKYTLKDLAESIGAADDRVPTAYIRQNQHQVQYLDLDESKKYPIRLNTLFGKQLVGRAMRSVNKVMSYDTQVLSEPPLREERGVAFVDFNGANGMYFWELFFYVPWLAASAMRETRNYEKAWQWTARYLFDPYRGRIEEKGPPLPFWNSVPLVFPLECVADTQKSPELSGYRDNVHFQMAMHNFVVTLWQMHGDEHYRRLTLESLRDAWLSYQRALQLIGPMEDPGDARPWRPVTLASRSATFVSPVNIRLRELRDLILQRLHNLRHGRTIDGVALPFIGHGLDEGLIFGGGRKFARATQRVIRAKSIPHYRFREVITTAHKAVEQLTSLGRYLFHIYEREAENAFEVEQQKTLVTLADFDVTLKRRAIDSLAKEKLVLEKSKLNARRRIDHYTRELGNGRSALEGLSSGVGYSAVALKYATHGPIFVKSGLALIPKIWGMAFGGAKLEASAEAIINSMDHTAEAMRLLAEDLRTEAGYERRNAEFRLEIAIAEGDEDVLSAQIEELKSRHESAQQELKQAIANRERVRAEYQVQTTGFAIASTYTWMLGRLGDLFASAYQSVLALCLDAEASYMFETGDFDSRHIRLDAWDGAWRGMFAGEALQNDLNTLQAAFLSGHERKPIIHKVISLKTLLGGDDKGAAAIRGGLEANRLMFDIDARELDTEYPGQYMRQIKHLAVEIRLKEGAEHLSHGKTIRVVLRQRSNTLLCKPDKAGLRWMYNPRRDRPASVIKDLRGEQVLFLSYTKPPLTADPMETIILRNEFMDGRYTLFEGTGVISKWTLQIPGSGKPYEQYSQDIEDIILHLDYTALWGGTAFATDVMNEGKAGTPSPPGGTPSKEPVETPLVAGPMATLPDVKGFTIPHPTQPSDAKRDPRYNTVHDYLEKLFAAASACRPAGLVDGVEKTADWATRMDPHFPGFSSLDRWSSFRRRNLLFLEKPTFLSSEVSFADNPDRNLVFRLKGYTEAANVRTDFDMRVEVEATSKRTAISWMTIWPKDNRPKPTEPITMATLPVSLSTLVKDSSVIDKDPRYKYVLDYVETLFGTGAAIYKETNGNLDASVKLAQTRIGPQFIRYPMNADPLHKDNENILRRFVIPRTFTKLDLHPLDGYKDYFKLTMEGKLRDASGLMTIAFRERLDVLITPAELAAEFFEVLPGYAPQDNESGPKNTSVSLPEPGPARDRTVAPPSPTSDPTPRPTSTDTPNEGHPHAGADGFQLGDIPLDEERRPKNEQARRQAEMAYQAWSTLYHQQSSTSPDLTGLKGLYENNNDVNGLVDKLRSPLPDISSTGYGTPDETSIDAADCVELIVTGTTKDAIDPRPFQDTILVLEDSGKIRSHRREWTTRIPRADRADARPSDTQAVATYYSTLNRYVAARTTEDAVDAFSNMNNEAIDNEIISNNRIPLILRTDTSVISSFIVHNKHYPSWDGDPSSIIVRTRLSPGLSINDERLDVMIHTWIGEDLMRMYCRLPLTTSPPPKATTDGIASFLASIRNDVVPGGSIAWSGREAAITKLKKGIPESVTSSDITIEADIDGIAIITIDKISAVYVINIRNSPYTLISGYIV